MNLDFGILWIEDSFSDEEKTGLERRVRGAGFIARIEDIPNGTGLAELAKAHRLFHRYDMILLDYKLRDEHGDELAEVVRERFPTTTILFYSGNYAEDRLRTLIAEKRVEGVYVSHRDRFIDRAGALIDETASSLDRLSGMRGLSMRVVAECDAIMRQSVVALSVRSETCRTCVTELDSDVLKDDATRGERYKAAMEMDLEARLSTRAVDSMKLHKHFRRVIRLALKPNSGIAFSDEDIEQINELHHQTRKYGDEVLSKRNTLGHAKEIETDKGWALDGSNGMRVEDFPALRQTFADHIDGFQKIVTILNKHIPQEAN